MLCEFISSEIPVKNALEKIQKSLVYKNVPILFLFHSVLCNTLPSKLNYHLCSKHLRVTSGRYENIHFSNITYLQLKRSFFTFFSDNNLLDIERK